MNDSWCISKATEATTGETDSTCWLWIRRYYQLLANEWLVLEGGNWLINLPKLVNDQFLNLEKLVYVVSVTTRFLFGLGLSKATLGTKGWAEMLKLIDIDSCSEKSLLQSISNLMASTAGATAKILVEDFAGYVE